MSKYRWLSPTERSAIFARFRAGAAVKDVAAEFDVPSRSMYRLRDEVVVMRRRVEQSPHRLSFEERERIRVGIAVGESDAQIARVLGRHRSTVGREIARCGRRCRYRALEGERHAQKAARRPKPTKLASASAVVGGGRAPARGRLLAGADRRAAAARVPG